MFVDKVVKIYKMDVPKLFINILLNCMITYSSIGKWVEFTLDLVFIFKMSGGSRVSFEEVNQHSKLYSFSHCVPKSYYIMLLTHANEESKLWHKRFGHFNYGKF